MIKNILIIGGTNFIGPIIVKKLLKINNYKLSMVNRTGNNLNIKDINVIKCDRNSSEFIDILISKKFDIIIDMCLYKITQLKKIFNVLKDKKAKYIFISSIASYKKSNIFPVNESSELGEWDLFGDYGKEKMLCEKYLINQNKVSYVIIKPTYILGINNYINREKYYIDKILNNETIYIHENGNALIQFVDVEDVAESVFRCTSDDIINQTFNISNDTISDIHYLINIISNMLKKSNKIKYIETFNNEIPFKNQHVLIDNSKSKKLLNIKYINLEEMIKKYLKEYKHYTK